MTVADPIKKMTPRGTKPRTRTNAAGRELMAAVKQAHDAVMSADPFLAMTVREVEIPDPPAYAAADVKAVRARLGVSVTLFARLTGVSAKLVEHWEQGRRTPAPWSAFCSNALTPTLRHSSRPW